MSTPDQERFLSRIRSALGYAPEFSRQEPRLFQQAPSTEDLRMLERIHKRTASERQTLLERLMESGKPINLHVIPVPTAAAATEAILARVEKKQPEWGIEKEVVAWRHPLIDRLDLKTSLKPLKIRLHLTEPMDPGIPSSRERSEREHQRNDIIASYIGVTSADFCMADTATLVMRNRPGQPRSAALVPSIHIAVITRDRILADMKELFALLRWDERYKSEGLSNYMSFISGPSKTADIEATMVRGAHGPREVYLYVVSEEELTRSDITG